MRSLVRSTMSRNTQVVLSNHGRQITGFRRKGFINPAVVSEIAPRVGYCQRRVFKPILLYASITALSRTVTLVGTGRCNGNATVFAGSNPVTHQFRSSISINRIKVGIPVPIPLPVFDFANSHKSVQNSVGFCNGAKIGFCARLGAIATL